MITIPDNGVDQEQKGVPDLLNAAPNNIRLSSTMGKIRIVTGSRPCLYVNSILEMTVSNTSQHSRITSYNTNFDFILI